jgi:hypothetical protein
MAREDILLETMCFALAEIDWVVSISFDASLAPKDDP